MVLAGQEGPESGSYRMNTGKIMAKFSLMGLLPKGAPVSVLVTK